MAALKASTPQQREASKPYISSYSAEHLRELVRKTREDWSGWRKHIVVT